MTQTRLLPVDGGVIAYQLRGDGEPCVLVCGAGGTKERFEAVFGAAFRDRGFQTVVYDPRGIGESSDDGRSFDIFDQRDDLIQLVEHLDLGPCHLFGISMGSLISQETALARPDLVRSVVLVATLAEQTEFTRRHYPIVSAHEKGTARMPDTVMAMYSAVTLFSPNTLNDDAKAKALLETWTTGNVQTGPEFARQIECNTRYDDRLEALSGIQVPCLVVSYEHDLCTPATRGRELADAISDAEFRLINDAGHLGILERQQETLDVSLSFLARHQGRSHG